MASNQEILSSFLEFLLLQPTPNSILNSIFVYLPISPPFSPRLLKSVLLRHLCQRPFTLETLTSLELLEQLNRDHLSQPPSKTLQLAYSAVAVDLTARFLRNDGRGEGELGDFFDVVNRIWNVRVGDLEEGEGKGLVSETLREERRLMEKAVWDVDVRELLRRMDTGGEAVKAVGVYIREAVKDMGPTVILEAATEEVMRWADGKENGGSDKVRMPFELNESSDRGECSANEFSHLSLPRIIQEKNQLKSGDQKDHDMAEKPSSAAAGDQKDHDMAEKPQSQGEGDNPSIFKGGHSLDGRGSDLFSGGSGIFFDVKMTRICSHLPLPNVIQENQLKQRVEMYRSMIEELLTEKLQVAGGISTVGTGDVSNHEKMEGNQSHLLLPNVIQENQLKQRVDMDRNMVEEPLPAILQTAAGISTVGIGDVSNHERMEVNQSHLPLPNVMQENQLEQEVEMDRSMVEEPLPAKLQAAAGISTVGTGDLSNHERMEENQSHLLLPNVIQENQLKQRVEMDRSMVEEPLPRRSVNFLHSWWWSDVRFLSFWLFWVNNVETVPIHVCDNVGEIWIWILVDRKPVGLTYIFELHENPSLLSSFFYVFAFAFSLVLHRLEM